MCLLTTFIYVAVPIFAIKSILKDFHLAGTKEMKATYGALYEGKAIRKGRKVLWEPIYFIMRRLTMIFVVVYAPGKIGILWQMAIVIAQTIFAILIVYSTEAFSQK